MKLKFKEAFLFSTSLLLTAPSTFAAGRIEQFQMKSCGARFCIEVLSDKASVDQFSRGYSLEAGHVLVLSESHGVQSQTRWDVRDLSIDFESKRILIREIVQRPFQQASLNMETGEILYFRKPTQGR